MRREREEVSLFNSGPGSRPKGKMEETVEISTLSLEILSPLVSEKKLRLLPH